ncbi:MAG: hypothetical protein U0169_25865 [Polyangiaceae bacterium]
MGDPGALSPESPPAGGKGPPWFARTWTSLRDYFLAEDPVFLTAIVPLCFLSMALFTRTSIHTNFIFDEQEALLANPYVRSVVEPGSKIHWFDAFRRDFWGLPPEHTIGSYRPIPDLVWRALWKIGARDQSAFPHHWINVLTHGVNGALATVVAFRWTKNRRLAWFAGLFFVASAVLTEAVAGVVGIADVLGGMGTLLGLLALTLPLGAMVPALFLATTFGMFSKESALCMVPLVPLAAFLSAKRLHPEAPRPWLRGALAFVATAAAFVFYVEARRRLFPTNVTETLSVAANAHKGAIGRGIAAALRWFGQPMLPRDPMNNPLIEATPALRVSGALRVYLEGIGQVLAPWHLSGDYSSPQEPIPSTVVNPTSVVGGLAMLLPLLVLPFAWLRARKDPSERRQEFLFLAFGLVWVVVSYLPVSNIPVPLPTVRAERFWYFPVIGTSFALAVAFEAAFRATARAGEGSSSVLGRAVVALLLAFVGLQFVAARRHAADYADDLTFWDATRKAVPRSAKAHLNYSVMVGARIASRSDSWRTAWRWSSPRSGPWPTSTTATRSADSTARKRPGPTTCGDSSSPPTTRASSASRSSASGPRSSSRKARLAATSSSRRARNIRVRGSTTSPRTSSSTARSTMASTRNTALADTTRVPRRSERTYRTPESRWSPSRFSEPPPGGHSGQRTRTIFERNAPKSD